MNINKKGTVYADALFLDTKGNILLSDNPDPTPVAQATIKAIEAALKDRIEVLSNLFRDSKGIIYIDAVAPIHDNSGQPIAIVVLRSKAADVLYPLIQTWPTSSKTSETLLVCRDGDFVLFLNELRHRSNTALTLRVPLTDTNVPGVQAILGNYGRFRGKDYRGVEVLAVLQPVPQSPWSIVGKVDAGEILTEVKYRAWVIAIIVIFLIGISAGLIRSFYRKRQEVEGKQAEESLRRVTDRLALAASAGGVGIWDYDVGNNRLVWDDQMFRLYGITQDQFSGAYEAWQAGVHPEDRQRGDDEIREVVVVPVAVELLRAAREELVGAIHARRDFGIQW